ncbi:hypothetical protein [Arthrobacter sp. A5]|uniref:hypothetical protein n=1 Tax=Arthrobacter sp. A5 TaxID=576926 RepID=UPI003DA88903
MLMGTALAMAAVHAALLFSRSTGGHVHLGTGAGMPTRAGPQPGMSAMLGIVGLELTAGLVTAALLGRLRVRGEG